MNNGVDSLTFREIERVALGIRKRVLAHTLKNNGGYLSQACSAAEILACLYVSAVKLNQVDKPLDPSPFTGVPKSSSGGYESGAKFHGAKDGASDRLIISPAHYALVVYAALIETNRLREDGLDYFNRDGSTVEMIGAEHSPGFETTTGSLGQALSQGGGIALGRRIKAETGCTWVFMSDGEFQEGQTYEALAAASFHKLSQLRLIVDVNAGQCDGLMENVMAIEPLADRIKAFGWHVSVVDGHAIDEIMRAAAEVVDKPHAILCYTDPTRGLPILAERAPLLHYLRFSSETERANYQLAYEELVK